MIQLDGKTTKQMAIRFDELSKQLSQIEQEVAGFATKAEVQVGPILAYEVVPWADRLRDDLSAASTRAGMIAHALGEFPRDTPWGQQ